MIRLSANLYVFGKKVSDLVRVLKVHATKYRVLHVPAPLRQRDSSTVGASCVDLPVAPDCTMCDRNVHDPSTLRDVSVLPRNIFIL